MNQTISITNARKKIFSLINDAHMSGAKYLITDKGHAKAVLMSAEEFDSWQETMEVIKDFPNLDQEIKAAHKAYEKGDYITLDELLLKDNHEISRHSRQKSRKTTPKNR